MKTYKIEYELPPLRAIYFCEVDADTEAEAIEAFNAAKPGHRIRKIEVYDRINVAREAILDELARRYKAQDKSVAPLIPEMKHHWHKPQKNYFSGGGVMDCPVCGAGKLKYSRSGYNGHVCAQCTTDGCVWWKE